LSARIVLTGRGNCKILRINSPLGSGAVLGDRPPALVGFYSGSLNSYAAFDAGTYSLRDGRYCHCATPVAKPRGSECCLGAGKSVKHLSGAPAATPWRGLTPPARPSRRRRTARVLRILHESTLSRYFARPALVASVTWTQNGRASGGILPHNPSRRIAGYE
jgi:hypothetical protein